MNLTVIKVCFIVPLVTKWGQIRSLDLKKPNLGIVHTKGLKLTLEPDRTGQVISVLISKDKEHIRIPSSLFWMELEERMVSLQ